MDFKRRVREHLPPLKVAREPEIVDELAQHLQDLYDEAIASGLQHADAVARAETALPVEGAVLAHDLETASRSMPGLIVDRWNLAGSDLPPPQTGPLAMLSDLIRDLRYALRMLAGAPTFTTVVVMTLALGVGANAIIFTAVDAILLESAGLAGTDTLVSVYNANTDGRQRFSSVSFPDYADLRDAGVFEDTAAFGSISVSLDDGTETEAIPGELVTGNYFRVLGVTAARGRTFVPDEDRRGTPLRVVVVSYSFWQNRLGASAQTVGSEVHLNGSPYVVIGIAPRRFVGATIGRAPEVWLPMALHQELRPPSAGLRRSLGSADLLGARGPRWLNMVARVRPETPAAQQTAALEVLAGRLRQAYPETNGPRTFHAVPLGEGPGVRTSTRPLLYLLSISVALVLLIACANVTSLLVARSVSRRRETAVRAAVGASRSRLVRQWLTESLLLALVGGVCGLALARWGAPLLHLAGIPPEIALEVNRRVLFFTFAAAAASGVLSGLAPVLHTLRSDTITALRDEGGSIATGVRAARWRRAFVVFQVAVSLMLLVGAGLFLRTLRNAHAIDLGYQLDSTMVADINLDVRGYSQEAGGVVYRQILERLRSAPGVAAAGAARVTVLSGGARTVSVSLDGQRIREDLGNNLDVRLNVISDGYLQALGIPVLRGRDFPPADSPQSMQVAIVSQSLAARLWPGQEPLGKAIGDGVTSDTVVGVVPDTVYRSALEREAPPFYYVPLAQNYEAGVGLHVRAVDGDPLALLSTVRSVVHDVDPRVAVARPQRLRDVFDQSIASQRMMATLVGAFGALALLLAVVGVYGIMEHVATQRRAEIGIRLALGAGPASIFSLILVEGLRLVGIGTAIGLTAAFATTRYIQTLLFGVDPLDATTFIAVSIVLTATATLACLIPARRAMRVDPLVAFRER
jgi:putative ABC transport system permease protein